MTKVSPLTTTYTILSPGGPFHLKLAVIADFHEAYPEPVLEILRQQQPDLIFIVGDLLERHEEGMSPWTHETMMTWMNGKKNSGTSLSVILRKTVYALTDFFTGIKSAGAHGHKNEKPGKKSGHPENAWTFLREAARMAPVYYSVGNHEWYFTDEDQRWIKKTGTVLLDNTDTVFKIQETCQEIHIGGLSTRYDLKWLNTYAQKPGYKILLCHHPEYYVRYIQGQEADNFDLVLSGHAHGGQWRFFGRGVYAPGQGLFPKYTRGVYKTNPGRFVVSAGIHNTAGIPRLGNPCELVIINI